MSVTQLIPQPIFCSGGCGTRLGTLAVNRGIYDARYTDEVVIYLVDGGAYCAPCYGNRPGGEAA